MALSGVLRTNAYEVRYYEVTWKATQSIVNNSTRVEWSLNAVGGTWYAERTLKFTIAGQTIFDKTERVERWAGEITAGWVDIPHDANGNASFSINLQVAVFGSTVNCTASNTFTLDTIARATVPSVNKSSVDFGSQVVISLPRLASSFKHSLKYTFGGVSNTFATNVDTSYTWTIPLDFMNRIPSATSGVVTISCLTYSGSTLIGTKTVNVTATVPSSVVPTINGVSVVEATQGIKDKFGVFLTDQSTYDVDINAVGAYSSTIASYTTTFVGATYTGSKFNVGAVSGSGDYTFSVTVKDSRGRTAKYNHTINVVEYLAPRLVTFYAFRCNANKQEDDEGAYILIEYGHSISSISNKNDKSYALEIKSSSDSNFTTIDSGNVYFYEDAVLINANIDDSYTIRLTASDYFTTITREIEAPTGYTLVDYHESGRGVAFGKVSERENAMEINFSMYDKYDTLIGNGIASYKGSGGIDANTTIEAVFISSTNTPDTGLWNVSQIFYQEKSATANRMQYAIPYAYDNQQGTMIGQKRSHYRRNYVVGFGWSKWYEIPVLIESGKSGIWTYEKWSNGKARVRGKIPVSSVSIQTGLGAWYRSGLIYSESDYPYPFSFAEKPVTDIQFFTTNTAGALLWYLNDGTLVSPPTLYLVRPVTGDNINGYIHIIAEGPY